MKSGPDPILRFEAAEIWYGVAALFLGISLTPLFWPRLYDSPFFPDRSAILFVRAIACLTPVAAAWFALRGAELSRRERIAVCLLGVAAAGICEVVHFWVTDRGHYFGTGQFANNTVWQLHMHEGILALKPDFLPHSYRFLPDCLVQILTACTGSFEFSRSIYRLVSDSLFFVVTFRYARVYVSSLSAAAVVLVVVALYPISILKYAGQLVDPLSHLSFVACLFFLARRYEPGFGPVLLVGLFAKESVLVMALCRLFSGPTLARAVFSALGYLTGAIIIVAGIRLGVNHGHMGYGQISGVDFSHIKDNLAGYQEWGFLYLATFGVLLPGSVLGWRHMDFEFRMQCAIVVSAVVISSIIFSWLTEVRNMVPAFVMLAVVNLRFIERTGLFAARPSAG